MNEKQWRLNQIITADEEKIIQEFRGIKFTWLERIRLLFEPRQFICINDSIIEYKELNGKKLFISSFTTLGG